MEDVSHPTRMLDPSNMIRSYSSVASPTGKDGTIVGGAGWSPAEDDDAPWTRIDVGDRVAVSGVVLKVGTGGEIM